MTYIFKPYEIALINKINAIIANENKIKNKLKNSIDKVSLEKLLNKISLYFENEAFFDEWEMYDPTLPQDFSKEEITIIKVIAGFSYWDSTRETLRNKLEKRLNHDENEEIINAIYSFINFDENVFDSVYVVKENWEKLGITEFDQDYCAIWDASGNLEFLPIRDENKYGEKLLKELRSKEKRFEEESKDYIQDLGRRLAKRFLPEDHYMENLLTGKKVEIKPIDRTQL